MYTGFLSASQLKEVEEVASFDKKKKHVKIDQDVDTLPVYEWQRPLDEEKTE